MDKDLDALKAAGGLYLGELEVHAEKDKDLQSTSGASNLDGRVSIEAAQRGATHYTLTASEIDHSVKTASDSQILLSGGRRTQVATEGVKARYALWRVEAGHWSELSKELQPTTAQPGVTEKAAAPKSASAPQGTQETTAAPKSVAK
jgi:hypothetical protein